MFIKQGVKKKQTYTVRIVSDSGRDREKVIGVVEEWWKSIVNWRNAWRSFQCFDKK